MTEATETLRPGSTRLQAAFATLDRSRLAWAFAVGLVVLGGALLRFHGLGWDRPNGADLPAQMHPDERFISLVNERITWPSGPAEYFDTARSPLNPYNHPDTPSFVYGTFPLFLVKAVHSLAAADVPLLSSATDGGLCEGLAGREYSEYDSAVVCGRHVSALFDTGTIALVFLLGMLLFGRWTGLLASSLYALSVLPTQLAHFWTFEPYVVTFGVAAAVLSVLFIRAGSGGVVGGPGRSRIRAEALATAWIILALGLCLGLALASKVTAWPVVVLPVIATGVRIARRDLPRLGLRYGAQAMPRRGHWTTDLSLLCTALVIGMLVFRVAQPYAFAGPDPWDMGINPQWKDDIFERELRAQNGDADVPPFIQFAGRTPYLWPLQNMVQFGLGPALGLAAWAAFLAACVVLFRRRDLSLLLPLAMVAMVFGFQGGRFVAYMRYFALAYPFLALLAAWGLVALAAWAKERRWPAAIRLGGRGFTISDRLRAVRPGYLAAGAMVAVVGASAWWALAFQTVYFNEHPRLAASRWLYENAAPGSRVSGEIWDDTLPYAIPGEEAGSFPLVPLYPFDTDSVAKVRGLVYGQAGPDASLGLNGADYVAITSNRAKDAVPRLPAEYPATIRYYELLESGELGFDLVAHFRVRPSFLGLSVDDSNAEESFTVYDHPEVWIYRKTERWTADRAFQLLNEAHPERAINLLPSQGRTNGLQFTPDEARAQQQGGTFSDLFGGGITNRLPWLWWLLWLEVSAFATVPALAWVFRGLPDRGYGLSKLAGFVTVGLLSWLIVAWDVAHFSRALVLGVFSATVAVGLVTALVRRRALKADIRERWPVLVATEMVFLAVFSLFLAYRAANPDLWHPYQGGEKPMELGYLSAVSRSTILPPFDPWFGGGTMNYYYMGWFLLSVPMRALRTLPEVGFNLGIATYAALAATVAFSTVHNLAAMGRGLALPAAKRALPSRRTAIIVGLAGVVLFLGISNLDGGRQAIERFQQLNVASSDGVTQTFHWPLFSGVPFLGGLVGFVSGLYRWVSDGAPLAPYDWWRASRVHAPAFDITEFPYWSFLFGDLHAHLMGLPFFGLVIALAVAYVRTAADGLRRQALAIALVMGIAFALVRMVHTWDYYTALLLGCSAIAAGQLLAPGRWQTRWWAMALHLGVAAAAMTLPFVPYGAHFEVFDSGLKRAVETTDSGQYFAHFGLFVAIVVAFAAVRYVEERKVSARNSRNPVLATLAGPWEAGSLAVFLIGLTAFTWRFGLSTIALSAVLLIFLLNLLWLEWRHGEGDVARILATAMFAAAIGIGAGIDIVQANFDIERMNTVFKFSLQAWQLYALASGYGVYYVARALWRVERGLPRVRPGRGLAAFATSAVFGVLLLGSVAYLWSGTRGAPGDALRWLAFVDLERAGLPGGWDVFRG